MAHSNETFILIAEDDSTYASVYENKLTHAGYSVTVARDGSEALKKAKERTPNLIVLDLIMPEKDGFEVLEELQRDETLKDVPVVVFSNLGQEQDRKRVKELGAKEYLVKADVTVQEMVDVVGKYAR